MAKKEWTPEERRAFGEKMKATRAAKTVKLDENTPTLAEDSGVNDELPAPAPQPVDPGMQSADVGELIRRIQELEAAQWRNRAPETQTQPTGPQAGVGGLIGTFEKYRLSGYPDPRQRLSQEPRLQRFAFPMNYELAWEVGVSQYKTLDGVNTKEPKFTIELIRILIDEDTGEPTDGRYTICRGIFHEDPEAALIVAQQQGITVDESDEAHFLNEMRYLRIRDWLLEAFYPAKVDNVKKNKREMVINGKLVEYFEVNSENSEAVPFGQLTDRKKML